MKGYSLNEGAFSQFFNFKLFLTLSRVMLSFLSLVFNYKLLTLLSGCK